MAALLFTGTSLTPSFAQAPISSPAPAWGKVDAEALLTAIEGAEMHGLDPQLYNVSGLKRALARGERIDAVATNSALALARDLRYGRVATTDRVDWHLGEGQQTGALVQLIWRAVEEDRVGDLLDGLAPSNDEYRALQKALAQTATTDIKRRTALKVNLERWRWMPRALGDRHVFVNLPSYKVEIVERGETVATHDAIIGKPASPTPAFSSMLGTVVLNPDWYVPPSLKAQKLALYNKNPRAARAKGYSVKYSGGQVAIRQAPGPANALGQMKLLFPNEWDIYLHDTSDRHLFAKTARALSAGCVRVKDPIQFVERLAEDRIDPLLIETALAEGSTERLAAPTIPIHITYLTAETGADGQIRLLGDPYNRDARVAAALAGRTQMASLD